LLAIFPEQEYIISILTNLGDAGWPVSINDIAGTIAINFA
jgi:hypothetical protein